MNPWIVITLVMAGVVFGIDYVLRRTKWKDNSKEEKVSLLINMFSVGPYAFLSALGMLWGIASGYPETTFGEVLYNGTLMMGGTYFVVAIGVVIVSLYLRKKGKIKPSIWINVIALVYIVVVLAANYLVGEIM